MVLADLWQRGLSLYYARRFEDGSEQFLTDVSLNPNDTEETIWKFLCDAQLVGFNQAQEQMLKVCLPLHAADTRHGLQVGRFPGINVHTGIRATCIQVGKDRRPVMRAAYDLFQGNGSTEKVIDNFEMPDAHCLMFHVLMVKPRHIFEFKSFISVWELVCCC